MMAISFVCDHCSAIDGSMLISMLRSFFWVKSVCLVAYEIVSDVYLKGSGNPYTVKGVVERGRWLFFLEVPSGCQTRPKIWMIFLVLTAFWLTLMSDKKCKNLHGNGGFSAPIVVRVFRNFQIFNSAWQELVRSVWMPPTTSATYPSPTITI